MKHLKTKVLLNYIKHKKEILKKKENNNTQKENEKKDIIIVFFDNLILVIHKDYLLKLCVNIQFRVKKLKIMLYLLEHVIIIEKEYIKLKILF